MEEVGRVNGRNKVVNEENKDLNRIEEKQKTALSQRPYNYDEQDEDVERQQAQIKQSERKDS